MKKVMLVILGLIFGCLCLELLFRVCGYKIKLDEINGYFGNKEFFLKANYLEIYDKFFVKEGDYYVKQRSSIIDIGNQKFKVKKDTDIKRIFVVGGSVAAYYDVSKLYENLEKYIPEQKFEVINAGMGSYDTYREEKILKEIVTSEYKPDYIVLMVGGTDGTLFDPIMINYLPYKYKAFRTSYILNGISNLIMPRYHYNIENVYPYLKRNIIKMVKDVDGKYPMIFVTVPMNVTFDNNYYSQRRDLFRKLSKEFNNVYVADFDKVLKSFIEKPKNEIFIDDCHFHNDVYDFLSKVIIEQISGNKIDINEQYFSNLIEQNSKRMLSFLDNIKTYNFDGFIKFIGSMMKDINNDDEFRIKLLEACSEVWCGHDGAAFIFVDQTLPKLDDFIEQFLDKSEFFYILKAVSYFYLDDNEKFEENMQLAIKKNPTIAKKINN